MSDQHVAKNPISEFSTKVREYPQIIKYMGSKAKIVEFISTAIESVYDGGDVCDLFSGACSLSGALGGAYPIHSNDIQKYSSLIASIYLNPISDLSGEAIVNNATDIFHSVKSKLPSGLEYSEFESLECFNLIEKRNQALLNHQFRHKYHLFLKNYSGTWWSAEQCIWIDAIKQVIDKKYECSEWNEADYAFSMTILMHSMAYTSQGTGHFAQYRDAKTFSSMTDINIYRQKKLPELFLNKFNQIKIWNRQNVTENGHTITSLDYRNCLHKINNGTVYADPPYAFVHYSRFYHALETIALYDYPNLQFKNGKVVKGRYREIRHQSPFSIKTQVEDAFRKLFHGVNESNSNLVLSYSNAAMISIERLVELSKEQLASRYELWVEEVDHHHMTMGRLKDHRREVKELVLLARK